MTDINLTVLYLYSSSPSVLTIQSPTTYHLPSFGGSDLQASAKRQLRNVTKDVIKMRLHMVSKGCVLSSVAASNAVDGRSSYSPQYGCASVRAGAGLHPKPRYIFQGNCNMKFAKTNSDLGRQMTIHASHWNP